MRVLRGIGIHVLLAVGTALAFPCHALFATEPPETTGDVVLDTTLTVRPDRKVDLDWARWQAQARTTYVSSGAIAFTIRMIDGNQRTAFRFSGADLHPTVVVQLGRDEELHRVSAIFDPSGTAKLNVYLLNEPPKKPGDFGSGKPLTFVVKANDSKRAAIDFAPTQVRYIVFRWTRTKASRWPFEVAEVEAFGLVSPKQLSFALGDEIHLPDENGSARNHTVTSSADLPVIAVASP
jgi:hypothetical protein